MAPQLENVDFDDVSITDIQSVFSDKTFADELETILGDMDVDFSSIDLSEDLANSGHSDGNVPETSSGSSRSRIEHCSDSPGHAKVQVRACGQGCRQSVKIVFTCTSTNCSEVHERQLYLQCSKQGTRRWSKDPSHSRPSRSAGQGGKEKTDKPKGRPPKGSRKRSSKKKHSKRGRPRKCVEPRRGPTDEELRKEAGIKRKCWVFMPRLPPKQLAYWVNKRNKG